MTPVEMDLQLVREVLSGHQLPAAQVCERTLFLLYWMFSCSCWVIALCAQRAERMLVDLVHSRALNDAFRVFVTENQDEDLLRWARARALSVSSGPVVRSLLAAMRLTVLFTGASLALSSFAVIGWSVVVRRPCHSTLRRRSRVPRGPAFPPNWHRCILWSPHECSSVLPQTRTLFSCLRSFGVPHAELALCRVNVQEMARFVTRQRLHCHVIAQAHWPPASLAADDDDPAVAAAASAGESMLVLPPVLRKCCDAFAR